jgi:hypothetical protein
MRGEGEGTDARRAFEEASEHVAKRLRRYRRRVNEHARSVAAGRDLPEEARQVVLRTPEEDDAPQQDGADHPAVVAESPAAIERLTVGEAVMRMDLAHVPVLMFRNRLTDGLNVVYRRPDGHIGWIDPGRG